jgi:hypothetical protein
MFMFKKQVLAIVILLLLGGCASGAIMSGMTVPVDEGTIISDRSALYHAIEIYDVSGGEETNPMWVSKVSNSDFRAALENTLLAHTMLAQTGGGQYRLSVDLQKLDQPWGGFDLKVTAAAHYVLRDKENHVVFDHRIETPYTADFEDSFLAYERIRLANEGAVRLNIETFIKQLIKDAESKPGLKTSDAGE